MTTQEELQKEWDFLLEQETTEHAPESYMKPGEILHRGDEDNPFPSRVENLEYKGYVRVWDTKTGDMSLQPRYLLWQTRKKKHEDGTPAFTLVDPQIPPNYGEDLFCPLNPRSPEYPSMKKMGFADCKKRHIPHQDGLTRHIRSTHKRAFEALERARQERIREEDRQLQKDMLTALTGAAAKGAQVEQPKSFTAECPDCGKVINGKTQNTANSGLNLHKRHCKANS